MGICVWRTTRIFDSTAINYCSMVSVAEETVVLNNMKKENTMANNAMFWNDDDEYTHEIDDIDIGIVLTNEEEYGEMIRKATTHDHKAMTSKTDYQQIVDWLETRKKIQKGIDFSKGADFDGKNNMMVIYYLEDNGSRECFSFVEAYGDFSDRWNLSDGETEQINEAYDEI